MDHDERIDPTDPSDSLDRSGAARRSHARHRVEPVGADLDASVRSGVAARARRRHTVPLDVLVVIAIGGILGAAGRYAIAEAIPGGVDEFPTATFVTNVVGSFLLGLVVVLTIELLPPGRYLRPFLTTGALGAFTTFSTFAVENVLLIDDDRLLLAVTYVVTTIVVGLAAAWAGVAVARSVVARSARPAR